MFACSDDKLATGRSDGTKCGIAMINTTQINVCLEGDIVQ